MDRNSRNEYLRQCLQTIETHGCFVQYVEGEKTELPFAYSIGLTRQQQPEIILIGRFEPQIMHKLIMSAVMSGETFTDWSVSRRVITKYPVMFREVKPLCAAKKVHIAIHLYQEIRLVQMFMPDNSGRFPWQPECAAEFQRQACLEYSTERC